MLPNAEAMVGETFSREPEPELQRRVGTENLAASAGASPRRPPSSGTTTPSTAGQASSCRCPSSSLLCSHALPLV